MADKELKVYRGKLAEFADDGENANAGTPRGNALLELSLREYKAGRSLLADGKGVLLGGNKTKKAATALGLDDVIVVETDGDELVVVKRVDLDLEKDEKARELAYMDNRAGEVNLRWDANQVAADIAEGVDLSLMFYDDELDKITGGAVEEDGGEEEKEAFPEMELQPFEHYDYVMLVFRDTFDWSQAVDFFGLEKQGFTVTKNQRKVGLIRVIDGRKALEKCGLSFQAEKE